MFRCCSLETSHPCLLPQSPKVCSIHLCLFFCFAYRVIINILKFHLFFLLSFPGGSDGKESACDAGDMQSIPGSGRSLEEGLATHPSVPAWRSPWTEEPGGLQSMGSQRVRQTGKLTLLLL